MTVPFSTGPISLAPETHVQGNRCCSCICTKGQGKVYYNEESRQFEVHRKANVFRRRESESQKNKNVEAWNVLNKNISNGYKGVDYPSLVESVTGFTPRQIEKERPPLTKRHLKQIANRAEEESKRTSPEAGDPSSFRTMEFSFHRESPNGDKVSAVFKRTKRISNHGDDDTALCPGSSREAFEMLGRAIESSSQQTTAGEVVEQ